jgi:sodium transport system permease protein
LRVELRTVWLVAAKELRESIRDRRTLFVALLLPVLLYPLMMLALAPLVSMQKQKLHDEAQPVAVTGPGAAAVRRAVLEAVKPDGSPVGLAPVESTSPLEDLEQGRIALWVETKDEFDATLVKEATAKIEVHSDGSDDRSLAAARKFAEALSRVSEAEVKRRVAQHALPSGWLQPIESKPHDVASPERRAAYLFGKMLAFILVVLTLSSSFYPAVDSVAGEKERGTMETLLVAPCGRAELVLGKFLAVLVVTLAAATLNLASMGLTLGPFGSVLAPDLGAGLAVTPTVIIGVLALLVPLSALFSAVSLALSTLARSVKEGQHYLTPLFLVVMPLAMVVVLPNVPLTKTLAPLPVTNAVLFFRDLLLGKTDAATTAIVMASTFAYAGAALWGCVTLFLREETLFRGPEGGTSLLARPGPRERPGGAAALFLFAACMSLVWYGQTWLPKDVVRSVLATQFLVILAPCFALTLWIRAEPIPTFRLRRPVALAFAAAALLGLGAPILNSALQEWIGVGQSPEMRRLNDEIVAYVRENPLAAALAFGALPAVCEELFFRGFVLSGLTAAFRGRHGATRAVLLSSALFAVFHVFPERWPPTFLMGVVLGVVAVRTGSIWPGMVVHAVNNSFAVLQAWPPLRDVVSDLDDAAAITGAAVLFAAGLVLVLRTRRPVEQLDRSDAAR